MQEPILSFKGSFRKPDVVAWKEAGEDAFVFEVQVVSDGFSLAGAHQRKVDIYKNDGEEIGKNSSVTISWRGCVANKSAVALEEVSLGVGDLQIMAVKAFTWTSRFARMEYLDEGSMEEVAAEEGVESVTPNHLRLDKPLLL